jgi:CBS domain containing-hemolysin-like protein
MDNISKWLLELVFLFFLIFLNGVFVIFEYSLIKVRESEIEPLIHKGNLRAKLLKQLKSDTDKYISATQLGITLVNLLLGWLGEPFFSGMFEPIFKLIGIQGALVDTVSTILGVAILTYFTILLGELTPKVIALRYPLKIASAMAFPINIFYRIFRFFISFLEKSSHLLLKLFGIKQEENIDKINSEEEIRYIIEEGSKSGVIDSTEQQLIEKIFEFNDKTAKDIMIPRNSIVALNIEDNREKIIRTVIEEGYSRIPVYKENIDNIIGVLYAKDLISAAEHRELILLQDLIRPVKFIPENKHIGEILKDFQKNHIHLGIVVNEHGGVEGVVTLEDIIEEIVGEIEDEYDLETPSEIKKDKRGIYLVNPSISIEEFNSRFKTDIPLNHNEYQTLSGFLQTVTGHIPEIFERIDYDDMIFIVTQKVGNKLMQVKIQKNPWK